MNQTGREGVVPGEISQRSPPLPPYLRGHYRWAYVWRPGVWFFDHLPVINCIVFGQYRRLVEATLKQLCSPAGDGPVLLVASAYGDLVSRLAARLKAGALTIIDVVPIQIRRARAKLERAGLAADTRVHCMDAEHLAFAPDSFDAALMFLLLNELPPPVRRRALVAAARVIRPGGRLLVTEYGALGERHPLHRIALLRWLITRAEPYLDTLWRDDLATLVDDCARAAGKRARPVVETGIFNGFYRVVRFRLDAR